MCFFCNRESGWCLGTLNKKGTKMKAEFYDVKAKKSVKADVIAKVVIAANGRFAFKGQTADGRPLTRFVSKADYDKCDAPVAKACAKKAACKKCAK